MISSASFSSNSPKGDASPKMHSHHALKSEHDFEAGTSGHKHGPVILEKGHLEFYYRQKLDSKSVQSMDDVQRFFAIMTPSMIPLPSETAKLIDMAVERRALHSTKGFRDNTEEERKLAPTLVTEAMEKFESTPRMARLWIMGSKSMPHVDCGRKLLWSTIEACGPRASIIEVLKGRTYVTRTAGQRELHPAEYMGRAYYEIIAEAGIGDTRLVYKLEEPIEPYPAQVAFGIAKEGTFRMAVKNPYREDPEGQVSGFTGDDKAVLPRELRRMFKGKAKNEIRWVPVNPTAIMNVKDVELLLFTSRKTIDDALGPLVSHEVEESYNADKVLVSGMKSCSLAHSLDKQGSPRNAPSSPSSSSSSSSSSPTLVSLSDLHASSASSPSSSTIPDSSSQSVPG